jgi:uncharacterized protein (DUF1800 family)
MRNIIAASRAVRIVALAAILAVSTGVLQAQKTQKSQVPAKADARTIAHVLDRMGFGARPGDVARVQQIGLQAYIDQQLHPERIADGALASRLSEFTTLSMNSAELAAEYFNPADQARQQAQQQQARAQAVDPAMAGGMAAGTATVNGMPVTTQPAQPPQPTPEQRQLQQRAQSVLAELMQAKLLRAALSERQLEEVLVDFWFNHFNVFVGKGQVRQYLTEYEHQAIRPYVLGNFRDMLGATAHSPAMLFYLDNFQSRAPNSGPQLPPGAEQRLNDPRLTPQQRQQIAQRLQQQNPQQKRPQAGLNENYARELMELHTLGVDGGYTQEDVIAVAKILTGWTIDRPQQGGAFVYRDQWHENGAKTVLGKTFQEAGEKEGERLLDMLAMHPKTAHHLAYKLAQRFVADEPPAALVDRAAKTYLDTKGDLREVTRLILTSPEFFDPKYFAVKVKTPLEFVVSAVRATGANIVTAQPMVQALQQLGMPLYGAQPPTGYSMTADAWVNSGALLSRMNFSLQLVGLMAPPRPDGPGRGGQPGAPGNPGNPGAPGAPARPAQQGQGQGDMAARLAQMTPEQRQALAQLTPEQRQALAALLTPEQRQALQNQADPVQRPAQQGGGRGGQQQANRAPLQVDVRTIATDTSEASVDRAVSLLLASGASDATRGVLVKATTPQQLVALALGSPEFQKR